MKKNELSLTSVAGFLSVMENLENWKIVQHHGNLQNSWNLVFCNTKSWKTHGKSISLKRILPVLFSDNLFLLHFEYTVLA